MPLRDSTLDLRFGILAVQTGLAAPEAVIAAARSERPADEALDRTLLRLGVLKAEDQTLIERLSDRLRLRNFAFEPVGWSTELQAALAASNHHHNNHTDAGVDAPAADAYATVATGTAADSNVALARSVAETPAGSAMSPRSDVGPRSDASPGSAATVALPASASADPLETQSHSPAPNPYATVADGGGQTPHAPGVAASPGSSGARGASRLAGAEASAAGGSRFRTIRLHARGGLGQVSLAIDEELNREVALKEIRPQFADDSEARLRFEREAKITGSLEHPGIVPVYGLGVSGDGRPYYAMRFIQGRSMKESIDEYHKARIASTDTRLMFRELLRRFIDMCNAVEYAHSRGIIHRDLKPDNVMLGPYGETLVVDWGLAKRGVVAKGTSAQHPSTQHNSEQNPSAQHDSAKHSANAGAGSAAPAPNPVDSAAIGADLATMHGDVLGTPAYMPPEQARGDWQSVGPTSDVYSLGATLYHIVAGKPAFWAPSVQEVLRQVIDGVFPRPRVALSTFPAALEAVCLKAMARRPEDRFGSARELAGEIERWMADEPVASYRESFQERWFRRMRRHRTWTMALAVVLPLLLIVTTTAAFWVDGARREAIRQKGLSDEAKEAEAAQKRIAVAATDEARRSLANLLLAGGERLQNEGDLSGAALWYVKALPHLDPNNKNALEAHRLRLALLLRQLPRPASAWTLPAEQRARVARPFLSPDGRTAIFCRSVVVGVDAETGKPLWPEVTYDPADLIAWAGFSPDGSRIIALVQKRRVQLLDAKTGKRLTPIFETAGDIPLIGTGPEGKAELSADNQSLALLTETSKGPAVEVWDVTAGTRRFDPLPFAGKISAIQFSRDGKQLLVGSEGVANFYDVENGKPSGGPIGVSGLWDAAYSPDGRWIAAASGDGHAQIYEAAERKAAGGPLAHRAPVTQVVFSPDSTRLLTLSADRTARIWDVATAKPVGEILDHADRPFSGSFSADGRRVVTVTLNHTVYQWDVATSRRIGAPIHHATEPAVRATADRLVVAVDGRGVTWDASRAADFADFTSEGDPIKNIRHLAFTPDGRTLVAAGDANIWLIDPAQGAVRTGPHDHGAAIRAMAVSADGAHLATAGDDGRARLWRLPDGGAIPHKFQHAKPIVQLRFDAQGKRLVTCSEDQTARLWDVATGTPIGEPLAHQGTVHDADFSPDGARVVTAGDDGVVQIWNAADGKPEPGDESVIQLKPARPFVLARFHPDGQTVMAALSSSNLVMWNPSVAGGAMRAFDSHSVISQAAFSPDGRFLLSAGISNFIHVWDTRVAGATPSVLPVVSAAFQAQFRPDSALVTASSFGGVQLWEADGGRAVGTRLGPLARALAFSPDGRKLVGADERLRWWDLTPDAHSLEDLKKLSSLAAMRSLDDNGNLQFLTADRIEALQKELSAKLPEDFRPSLGRVVPFVPAAP
jgi:WD40 repeat protein/serine/threonine protein kinase